MSFPPKALELIHCEERQDGSGDLIFENRRTWVGTPQPEGFLAIQSVREIEYLVRKTLVREGHSPIFRWAGTDSTPPKKGTYRISIGFRFFQLVALAGGSIAALCIVGDLVLALAMPVLFPGFVAQVLVPQIREVGFLEVAGFVIGGLASLAVAGVVAWGFFRLALATPTELALGEDGCIEFRSSLGTTRLRINDITSISTGGWSDPNRFLVTIRHKDGKVKLVNQFRDFRDFLVTVKSLNPSVEVKGF